MKSSDHRANAVRAALAAFLDTIDATGGVFEDDGGFYAPVGDPEWTDLGEAYQKGCAALQREPLIGQDPK